VKSGDFELSNGFQRARTASFSCSFLFNRKIDRETRSIQTGPSAIQSVGFRFTLEKLAECPVDGAIRAARGTGESE